jgi:8-oxo-dGTP diphosphatase
MELLQKIFDEDVGERGLRGGILKARKAARVVLFNESGEVMLINVSRYGFHTIPGGGIDSGEGIVEAAHREVKEETGCSCELLDELGVIVEYKTKIATKDISYCFIGRIEEAGRPNLTADEVLNGCTVKVLKLPDAIETFMSDDPDWYEGKFIKKRDLTFLLKAQEVSSRLDALSSR